ncbi:hypothetical protein D0C36_08900 [Mucilaginibacter conchicola]|uniref:Uncharacterized protein n=1 Tax=Mucilaginibacter conchicola TaxID=2303333 RepID=A0A372P1J9_9SPHI|nr:hypothetical protein D0C36_08900 [Mucilaginibacter conchicola]
MKIIVITLAAAGIFYTFNKGCVDFLKWYMSLQLLPQLFIGFAFGGVSWLMGRAINLLLLHWSYQQFSSVLPGLILLGASWLFHSILLFSAFKFAFFELSWSSVSAIILAVELSVYPLVAVYYQSKALNKSGVVTACPAKESFADITAIR